MPGVCASDQCDAPGVSAQPPPGAGLPSRVTTVPMGWGQTAGWLLHHGPASVYSSRSLLCLHTRSAPTHATATVSTKKSCPASGMPTENQLCVKGDIAITKLGTIKTHWLHVLLPWMLTQTLPKAQSKGWVWMVTERDQPHHHLGPDTVTRLVPCCHLNVPPP